jgi:hypothetical protein
MPVSQVQTFACTFQPGSTPTTPAHVNCQLGVFQVDWIELDVPGGNGGGMGFYLAASHQQYIPFVPGTFLIMDAATKHWDVVDMPNSGDWQVYGYNEGFWPHTVYVTFGLEVVANPYTTAGGSLPIAVSVLES